MATESTTGKCLQGEGCVTKYLTTSLYCCVAKRAGCLYGLAYGYEIFCQHPDREQWVVASAASVRPSDVRRPSPATEEF